MLVFKLFAKSKPLPFILLVLYLSFLFWWKTWEVYPGIYLYSFIKYFLLLAIFMGVNFIVKRNKITKKNTYTVFVFTMLWTGLPESFLQGSHLIAAFFVVLALRRILSLKTQLDAKKKIFDASLWIFIASLSMPSTILLLLFIWVAVLQYTIYDLKNLLIPILAWLCGALFFTAFQLWKTDEWVLFYEIYPALQWNDFPWIWKNYTGKVLFLLFYILMGLWVTNLHIRKASLALKTSLQLVILSFIVLTLGWMFSHQSSWIGYGLACIPLSILVAKGFELKFKLILKEILLIGLLIFSLLGCFYW